MDNKIKILDTIKSYKDFKNVSDKYLKNLCDEIRAFILDLSTKKSIHLGSNLGIVEISVALSKVFDLDWDIIFYDTGHQSYVHKIITGRLDLMSTIRETNGLSGMQDLNESRYDYYSGGHAGNSLSIAQGYIESIYTNENILFTRWKKMLSRLSSYEQNKKNLKKIDKFKSKFNLKKKYVIPIIGDSAIANGLAVEALSDIAFRKKNPIIVINDNEMSISETVGSMARSISKIKINRLLTWIEKNLYKLFWNSEFGKNIYRFIYKLFHGVAKRISGSNIFTSLGYQYIGPINGHNIKDIIRAANKAKWYQKFQPVVLHFKTIKGLGLENPKEDKIGKNHASIDVNGINKKLTGEYLCEHLISLLAKENKIKVINPAMTYNSGFYKFSQIAKNIYFDVGISEEHAISLASGMALAGLKPFVVIYSTFLQRSYDQLIHDISRLNLPVTLLIDRAEISGGDGDSHHGIFDVAFLKTVPNSIISAPSNINELKALVDLSLENKDSLFAIRYPKHLDYIQQDAETIEFLKNQIKIRRWIINKYNNDGVDNKKIIITYGNWVNKFKEIIIKYNYKIDLANAIFIKGYDKNQIKDIFKKYSYIYVFEEIYGDFGLADDFLKESQNNNAKIVTKNFKHFPGRGKNQDIYDQNNMNAELVAKELNNLK